MSNEIRSEVILISFNNFYYHVEKNDKIDTFNKYIWMDGANDGNGDAYFCILDAIHTIRTLLNTLTSCNHRKLPQFYLHQSDNNA